MGTFNNPIISGFNPDPSVVRVGNDYFLVTSSFEYFPGLPIYHSKDLLNWQLIGHGLTRSSQLNIRTVEPSAGVWAPTIRFHGGKFYLTTAKWDRYRPQTDVRIGSFQTYMQSGVIANEALFRKEYSQEVSISLPTIFGMTNRGLIRCILIIQALIKM
jgi:beta-xylosidase